MRLAIFSDIHANLEALESVLAAVEEEKVDAVLCGGDVVGYGASPNECVDIVRSLTDNVVLGNHDAAVAGRMDYSYYYDAARQVLDNHASALRPENMTWLKDLPYSRQFADLEVTLCHGAPINEQEFEYLFALEQAYGLLPYFEELDKITFIGHSHLCRVFVFTPNSVNEIADKSFTIDPDNKYIISVGSVGQPRDYDNRASYTVFDTETREFRFERVEYDIEASASKIFSANLERNFGNRLFIGV